MQIAENEPIVAFTLAHYPKRESIAALSRLGLDRLPLSLTPDLRFWRLLGVGKGRAFDPHADLQRYAMFTVWDSYAALKHFESNSSVMRRIQQRADEVWTVHMRPVRWHGKWGGSDPFAAMKPVESPEPGPWLILTRATLRVTKRRAFLEAVPSVAEQLLQQPDYINSIGVGESPFLHQATISLWRTLPSVTTFAYGQNTQHINVIRRTRSEQWYREELFARFRPLESTGTWNSVNPLA